MKQPARIVLEKIRSKEVVAVQSFVCSTPGCSQACNNNQQMKAHLFNAAHFSEQLTAMMAQEIRESTFVLEDPSSIAQAKTGGDDGGEVLPWDFSAWMGRIRADFDSAEAANVVELFLRGEEFTTIAALSGLQDKDLPTEWKNGRKQALLTSAAAVIQEQAKAGSKESKKRVRDAVGVVEYRCASCGWSARHQNASNECHSHKFYQQHFSAAIRDLMQQETAACEVKGDADAKMAAGKGKQEADECAGKEQEEQGGVRGGGQVLHEGHVKEEDDEDDEDERSKRRRGGDDAVDLQTFERSVVVTEGRPDDEPKFL